MYASALSFKWTMCFALLMCQYLCAKCWEKIYFWQNENFPFESLKKIHIPNMSLSCDIYRWQVYKKAITKFCYKDNFLCLSVFSNCAYFIAGCMRSLAFFSLPYFPSSKNALLIPFLQENRKIVSVAHWFWLIRKYSIWFVILWLPEKDKKQHSLLIVYSLPMFSSKESFKGSCPVVDFC